MTEVAGSAPTLFDTPAECCGCGACRQACPAGAIELVEDACGYVFPRIDESACIRCGRCVRACRFKRPDGPSSPLASYAAAERGPEIMASASGGVFGTLARAVLERGGAVVGCAYERDARGLRARHRVIEGRGDVGALYGSKYVQSDTSDSFVRVRELLEAGREVLFSGTPCQVAGLRGYLGERLWGSPDLLTADLVCHGVPSQAMLDGYLSGVEGEHGGHHVVDARFRPKRDGWSGSLQLGLVFDDGTSEFVPSERSSFYDAFLNLETLRESCYECPFAGGARPGDLTLGDFWGVEDLRPDLLEGLGGPFSAWRGVSCLLVNSERGGAWLERLGERTGLVLAPVDPDLIASRNDQLRAPAERPGDRDRWLAAFSSGGWAAVERVWRSFARHRALRRLAGRMVPAPVKGAIRRLAGR